MDENLRSAAESFGRALAASAPLAAYRRTSSEAASDRESLRLKAELDEVYDALIQRQAAGEIIAQGELDAYFDLEERVREHDLLARRDRELERVKDYFSEAHWILSSELGFNFTDLLGE